MFITATASNPLVVDLVAQAINMEISSVGFGYVFTRNLCDVYLLSPPKIKQTPNASKFAKERLAELGAMKRAEKIMLGVFLLLLALWAGALGLSLVLVSGVLSFDDVLKEKTAWNTLVWFSALVMMATMLGKLGVTQFLAEALGGLALGAPPLLYAFIMITSSNIMIIMLLKQLLLSLGQIMLLLRDGGG